MTYVGKLTQRIEDIQPDRLTLGHWLLADSVRPWRTYGEIYIDIIYPRRPR